MTPTKNFARCSPGMRDEVQDYVPLYKHPSEHRSPVFMLQSASVGPSCSPRSTRQESRLCKYATVPWIVFYFD
jgi:hypothetical protein